MSATSLPLPPSNGRGAPWPYPLLCLLWRLGLGGGWLKVSPPSAPPDALATTVAHLAAEGRARPALAPGLLRLLVRSPLGQLSAGDPGHAGALRTTIALFAACEVTPAAGGHARPAPPGWRAPVAAWLGPGARVWIPRPSPVWDPATWQLVAILEDAWEREGLTCLGRERPMLFRLAGTRRMAARFGWPRRRALACGRTAFRLWRHFFETQERPRIERLQAWPLPPAVRRVAGDLSLLYRQARAACRTGAEAPGLTLLPAPLHLALRRAARASVTALRPPVVAEYSPVDLGPLAAALACSPLGGLAARRGASAEAVHAAALGTAERLVRALSAPWPWRPRPVVRGPRRARQEQLRRLSSRT